MVSANSDTSQAWTYHNSTKHSEWSVRSNPHYLDFANQPLALKIYTTLDPIPLPREAEQTGITALSAISSVEIASGPEKVPTLADLARILYFSAGITKKKTYPGGEIYFRAASCTGALYEFELYLACGDLPELSAGLYHFNPGDYALRLLRSGDHRSSLVHAAASEPNVVHAPVIIVCAGTYWRNAWKYRARTYRHFGWDNGTMLANMLAMTAALQLPSRVVLGFVDEEVNRLLDLDTEREVAFSMVTIGRVDAETRAQAIDVRKLSLPTVALSKNEIEYPELKEIHTASSLMSSEEVAAWRGSISTHVGISEPSPPVATVPPSTTPIEQVILRRGSSRQFRREPIEIDQLTTILHTSTRGVWPGFRLLNDVYLIVNAVNGLAAGSYVYHPENDALELLKEDDFRPTARHLGLGQDLSGDAAVDVFFLADLHAILTRWGNRGYRAVQLEAGILGGKMYLAAYSQRLGATGLTFFDDDVTAFFSPHANAKSAIFLMAIGKGRKSQ
jgi:SagB-type dehydrogenase family enzyme